MSIANFTNLCTTGDNKKARNYRPHWHNQEERGIIGKNNLHRKGAFHEYKATEMA